jgi:GrpB-like predicted nucleotidyltransferase (UPF0157 family)
MVMKAAVPERHRQSAAGVAMQVRTEPYDPAWPVMFAAEKDRLERLAGRWLITPVEHIGSTSVPGLAAKPLIDMIAGVVDLRTARAAIGPLAGYGYVHSSHRPDALWFYKPISGASEGHTHHLHLTEPGSDLWRERLAFRDSLRSDPRLADQYQQLKQELSRRFPNDGVSYAAGKREFVAMVLARSGIRLRPQPR